MQPSKSEGFWDTVETNIHASCPISAVFSRLSIFRLYGAIHMVLLLLLLDKTFTPSQYPCTNSSYGDRNLLLLDHIRGHGCLNMQPQLRTVTKKTEDTSFWRPGAWRTVTFWYASTTEYLLLAYLLTSWIRQPRNMSSAVSADVCETMLSCLSSYSADQWTHADNHDRIQSHILTEFDMLTCHLKTMSLQVRTANRTVAQNMTRTL